MASIAQERLGQRFELWDTDGDGQIERGDFEAEARRILESFRESESSPRGAALMAAYLGMWDYLADKAGVGPDGGLDAEAFRGVATEHILEEGDVGFARVLRPTISAIVELCDTDGDGQVSPREFKRWIDAIGVSEAQADEAFRQIDVNGNGQLSVDELVAAVRDYHSGRSDVRLLGR